MDHTHDKSNSLLDTVVNLLTPSKGKQNNAESSGSDSDLTGWSISPNGTQKEKDSSSKIIHKKEVKNKKAKKGKLSPDQPRFCVPNCPRDGVYDSQMVQCHICQVWHHYDCGNTCDRELENVTVWSCQKCRKIPLMMTCLVERVEVLSEKMNLLLKSNEFLKEENAELRKMIEKQNILVDSRNIGSYRQDRKNLQEEKSDKILLIGSSILRDVSDKYRLQDTKVISKSGGKVTTIKEELKTFKNKQKFQQTCLVVGGNDVDSPKEIGTIITDYRNLITESRDVSEHVTIASVLPRKSGPQIQEKIDSTNSELERLCREMNCKFVNNNGTFKMLDGSMNDALYNADGVHLNKAGTSKLLMNLGLVYAEKTYSDVLSNDTNNKNSETKHIRGQHEANTSQWKTVSRRRHNGTNSNPKCHFCGVSGHMRRQCKFGDFIRCHKCNQKGHKARFCDA